MAHLEIGPGRRAIRVGPCFDIGVALGALGWARIERAADLIATAAFPDACIVSDKGFGGQYTIGFETEVHLHTKAAGCDRLIHHNCHNFVLRELLGQGRGNDDKLSGNCQ